MNAALYPLIAFITGAIFGIFYCYLYNSDLFEQTAMKQWPKTKVSKKIFAGILLIITLLLVSLLILFLYLQSSNSKLLSDDTS